MTVASSIPTPLALRLNRTVESKPVTASTCFEISMVSRNCGLNWRISIFAVSTPARLATAGNMRDGASAGPCPNPAVQVGQLGDPAAPERDHGLRRAVMQNEHRPGRDLGAARCELH